ncbi:MAG TPA: aspartate kinase, partial [Porticoccaceae bacterium]|nr:aspartate kinase [Porticoccaceae bacterium]
MSQQDVNRHTVEKIGGTSMSDYRAVRDNIIFGPAGERDLYQRIFVVSAYGGVTNDLLEHKKSGRPGIYALYASGQSGDEWREAMTQL